ncbi:MAG TPA: ferrous iron transporter B, partial [Pyrinomonadaceae bacterium]
MTSLLESPSRAGARDEQQGAPEASVRTLTVALAGNPNAGKTSLFNAVTGLRQKVANYPGVTVERKEGFWQLIDGEPPARVIDLPGLYSLEAASLDERIAHDVLTGKHAGTPAPDVIVAVVDATNLERNLYLVTQLLEMNRPLVVALTMVDLAERGRLTVDAGRLASALGVRVVPVTVRAGRGVEELGRAVAEAAEEEARGARWSLSAQAERELALLAADDHGEREAALRDLYAEELPEDDARRAAVGAARARLAEGNPQWWQEPLVARYEWIERVAAGVVSGAGERARPSATDRIDRFVTHKFFGPVIFFAVMLVVFQTIFSWASVPMDLIDQGFGAFGETVKSRLPEGLLADLLADGVIAGVGGVLVFLPQILLLFFFISLLEDSGYM